MNSKMPLGNHNVINVNDILAFFGEKIFIKKLRVFDKDDSGTIDQAELLTVLESLFNLTYL